MKSLDDGDSVVVVKTSVQPDKVTKEIMDAAKNADVRVSEKIGEITLDNGERPVFVVDTGEVVTDISVEKDGVVFVAKPLEPSEINKSGDEPAVDNAKVLHDEKPAANVVEPKHEMEHGHRNVQPKKQNLAQKNAEQHMDAQKETVADFENFSIYNMIAG